MKFRFFTTKRCFNAVKTHSQFKINIFSYFSSIFHNGITESIFCYLLTWSNNFNFYFKPMMNLILIIFKWSIKEILYLLSYKFLYILKIFYQMLNLFYYLNMKHYIQKRFHKRWTIRGKQISRLTKIPRLYHDCLWSLN